MEWYTQSEKLRTDFSFPGQALKESDLEVTQKKNRRQPVSPIYYGNPSSGLRTVKRPRLRAPTDDGSNDETH